MKLGANIHSVNGHWLLGRFYGQRSKVKVTCMWCECVNGITAEEYISTAWRRVSHVLGENGKIVNFTKKNFWQRAVQLWSWVSRF